MSNNVRSCKKCGKTLNGRADQKFCSDYCRNSFNNELNIDDLKAVRLINNILKGNRKILKKLNPSGTAKVSKGVLINNGFRFDYFTSIHTNKSNQEYRYCYEYGYLILNENSVLLVIRN